jgi:hypothetical protein
MTIGSKDSSAFRAMQKVKELIEEAGGAAEETVSLTSNVKVLFLDLR